jgi:predicted MFS family arabinose efflux permease
MTEAPTKLPLAALLPLSTAAFSTLLTEMMPAGLLPQMSVSLRCSPAAIGLLVSVCAIASTVAAIPVVAVTRGLPRRPLLIALLGGFVVVNATTAWSSTYDLTVVARILTGLLMGTLWPLLAGYAWHLTSRDKAGRAVAVALAGSTVAMSFGLPLGSVVGGLIGWRMIFAILSLVPLLLIGWVAWKLPPVPGETVEERISLFQVAIRPGFPIVLGATLVTVLAHYTLYTYMAPLAAKLQLAGGTGTALLLFGVGALVGIWIVGRTVDEHLRRTAWGAMLLTGATMLALGLFAPVTALDYVTIFLWGVSFGGVPTFFQTATNNTAGPPADVAASMLSTIYSFGIFGGSALGGLLLEVEGVLSLSWVTLIIIISAIALVAFGHRQAFPRSDRRPGEAG